MVSVIVPVYNVKGFISRGIESVLAQTYRDFELILSDDGSTDGSYELCRSYEVNDPRIRVIHQENRGAGAARNHGIEEAKGEFIYFFDIDDQIKPELLEYLVREMSRRDVDFICFGYESIDLAYGTKDTVTFPETMIESNAALREMFIEQFVNTLNGFPWNKFYRKSFLDNNNIRFEDQRIQQDEVFNLMCYEHLERAYLSGQVLYTYYIYNKGNTRSYFIAERFDIYKDVRRHFEQLRDFWELNDKVLDDYLEKRFYTGVLQCVFFNMTHSDCPWTRAEKEKEIARIMDDPLTLSSFAYADAHEPGLRHRLMRSVCRLRNLPLIGFYSRLLACLAGLRIRLKLS